MILPDAAAPPVTARRTLSRSLPYLLVVLALHLLALALLVPSARLQPLMWGLGLTAYLFGLRHAWDADHIAVIDNTVRKLLVLNRSPHGVGLFFSLGHSSVVLLMSVAAAFVGRALLDAQEEIGLFGSWVGPFVAGTYLLLVAGFNLSAAWRMGRGAPRAHHHGGLLARGLAPLTRLVDQPWHVFPLGLLMGLGFDTASEVALLALAGQAGQQGLSWAAILALPLLFGAGMTLFDTLNGAFMTHAYAWALDRPGARRVYNLLITGLSGLIALVIGGVTLGQWAGEHLLTEPPPAVAAPLAALQTVDVSALGFGLAGLALALFGAAQVWTRIRRD